MKKINLIDDSMGAIVFYRRIRELCSNDFNIYIDNLNYPYAMRKFPKDLLKSLNLKTEDGIDVYTNPSMAISADAKYSGIDNFLKKYTEGAVISNCAFVDFLKERQIPAYEVSVLINLVNDFDLNIYILDKLMHEYLSDIEERTIYVMDMSLCLVKEYFIDTFPDRRFRFLDDMLLEELSLENIIEKNKLKSRRKIYVSAYRRGFYLDAEEIFSESYIDIRNF